MHIVLCRSRVVRWRVGAGCRGGDRGTVEKWGIEMGFRDRVVRLGVEMG